MLSRTVLLTVLLGVAAVRAEPFPQREGYVSVPGGRVWYRMLAGGNGTPLIVLHGGPGVPSNYLKPLEALSRDRPVVFYDQLGCGRSDHPDDPRLWTVGRFVQELDTLRRDLGLGDVHILGHSWGTMLAVDAVLASPGGVRSLVLSSPCLDIPRWADDAQVLLRDLPQESRALIARHEKEHTTDAQEYQDAVMAYFRIHFCRLRDWPKSVQESGDQMGHQVYETMWGPSEFTPTGTLRAYDRTPQLKGLKLPVLYTCGRYDEATPASTRAFQAATPGAKLVIFEQSAHLAMQEETAAYVNTVAAFLLAVDAAH